MIVTHSTAIEGSTITLEESELMFEGGIVPVGRTMHEQMMNLDLRRAYEAAREVAASHTPVTPELLKGLAALVMRSTGALHRTPGGEHDESRGEFRLRNVSAGRGGHSYPGWRKVVPRTTEFCGWLGRALAGIDRLPPEDVYRVSFEAHYRLVAIHPWSDGNGRTSRLIMNIVQAQGNVVPSYVRHEVRADYIASLQRSRAAHSSVPFLDFMAQETARDLEAKTVRHKLS